MSGVMEVPLAKGGSVLVEVQGSPDGPALRGRRDAASIATASEPLEQLLGAIAPIAQALVAPLQTSAHSPHEIEVEFGVKLNAEAKVIIARASAEANFRVLLRWSQPAG